MTMKTAFILATVLVAAVDVVGAFRANDRIVGAVSPLATEVARTTAPIYKSNAFFADDGNADEARAHHASATTSLRAAGTEDTSGDDNRGLFDGIEINPLYVVPYVLFVAFGYYMVSTEGPGAQSQAILEKFIADPLHPGVNELFATVFNLIGLVGIPLACIIMPSARGQRFPAPPFLIASAAVGYGAIGPYVMTRKPVTSVDTDDLGWVTRNVLENKIFNWFMVVVATSSLFTTGLLGALAEDLGGTVRGYADAFASAAIVGVSSVDFAILCMTAASLIPEDLERRGYTDRGGANAIAASTLLLPMIGATIYVALRPPLPENE
mmetsp:Transcript_19679/g.47259  ORF Transcript_19679/g.47259 Transcript_19679/m.47259 type:complete len:324 (-) Transcript_19679:595-1566(-)